MQEFLLPLEERYAVADATMAFRFSTAGKDFHFEAGQNADFELLTAAHPDAKGSIRTFSIASSPRHRDFLLIATRMRESTFKNTLKGMPLGSAVKVYQPGGTMVLHEDAQKPAIFLAGGIGITPMRSIIEWATHEKKPHQLLLLYSNRNPEAAAFLHDFHAWERENPRFHMTATFTDVSTVPAPYCIGRIDERLLKETVADVHAAIYYIAGPPTMVDALKQLLLGVGVSRDNIRFESFTGY